jgi:hypothetical protein
MKLINLYWENSIENIMLQHFRISVFVTIFGIVSSYRRFGERMSRSYKINGIAQMQRT